VTILPTAPVEPGHVLRLKEEIAAKVSYGWRGRCRFRKNPPGGLVIPSPLQAL
jgi:hypothetical protein